MSDPEQKLKVLETHKIKHHLGLDSKGTRGGFIFGSEYVWFTNGADIVLYSKTTGRVESSRSFGGNVQTDNSIEITVVQELLNNEKKMNMLLVGCSSKSSGILFVCQLPTLMIIRCIHTPSPITYISTVNNESLAQNQLSDWFKVMSTILLVGLATGVVFAVDLRKHYIENQLRNNEIVENELSPSKLLILRKNEDIQEAKRISDHSDFHLAMFINDNYYKKECSGELNFGISYLLYTEEINAIAIGYITGHFQLWDCEIMQTLCVFKNPEFFMPITHITFLEQADQSNKLCYLWIIQSDNSRLPNAMMIALSYEHRTMLSNGHSSYRVYKNFDITLRMSLCKESGIGRCISALTSCNGTLVRKNNGVSENFGITLFAMLMEIRKNVNDSPESYIFLFDINQWHKSKMPSHINNFKVSNAYATFVKLPDYASYLDFNISVKTLRPFGSSFRNNIKNLFYPSSIYFECNCLLDTEIIRFQHVGIHQEVLNKLILKKENLFLNPNKFFCQCLRTNLRPSFWNKTSDYKNYSLLDKIHFVVSILIENNLEPVFEECALKWIKEIPSEFITQSVVKCLWNHIMLVKQYADQLCVPLFDCSGTLVGENKIRMLNDCLSQMLRIENLFKHIQLLDCIQITKNLTGLKNIICLVIQYFERVLYFLKIGLLPKQIIVSDFTSIIQYASKRRMEFGDLPLYLIDAIITNEPNGNKLIEQWKHECIEETKGLYPPSDVQCLLRIYLNAELSNQIKDFITIYFLIDVCSVQKMDEINANIFYDCFIKNNELYKLCCASWLFDHDMFEDAMLLILTSNNEWMANDKSWNWYHWTVLKLLVFKKQYYWAQIYIEFFDIKLVNLDDHKFYVNLQIMNNNCYDALCYLRKVEEKKILFEYIFERCLHTSQLKTFLNYSLDSDEKKLFYSCLNKFEDTKLIQFMFLVQEKRYSEAFELCKSLKDKTNSKQDNILKIASILVDKMKDNISPNNKNDLNKKVFSNEDIQMTFMNCFMDNQFNVIKSNTCRGYGNSCQINLIVPNDDIADKTQDLEEKFSIINGVLNPTKIETVKQIEDELLKLLDTPFIQNVSHLPSITNRLAVPKKKSATDNEQLSMTKLDETPQTLTIGLPDYNDNAVEKFSHKEVMSMKKIDPENENVGNNDSNNLPINMIANQTLFTFHKLLDNTEIEMLATVPTSFTEDKKEYDKLDISDNKQSDVTDGENGVNFKGTNVTLDDAVSVENDSDHSIVLHDDDTEANLKEPDIILNDGNDCNSSEQSGVILEGCVNEDLKESDFILCDDLEYYELFVTPDVNNEDNLEESYISLDSSNDTNYSEQQDNLLGNQRVELKSDQFCVIPNDEYENNLEEPNFIPYVYNEANVKEPDIILNFANDSNSSEQSGVILEGGINENLEESDFILSDGLEYNQRFVISDNGNEENLEEPYISIDGSNDTNNSEQRDNLIENQSLELKSDQFCVIPNDEYQNNLEEPNFISDIANKENLKETDVILNDVNYCNSSEQSDVLLENGIDENLEESSDVILVDDQTVENQTDQFRVIPDGENEKSLEKSSVIPNDDNEDILNKPDIILDDDQIIGNHSNQLSVISDDNNEENSAESSVTLKSENKDSLEESVFIPKGENFKNIEEPNTIFDDTNDHNNSKQSDMLLDSPSVPNHLDQLNVIPVIENENSLESIDVMPDCWNKKNSEEAYSNEQNLMKLFETLINKKTAENNDMVVQDDVIYPIDSQSLTLENRTLCIYGLLEENRSNDDNQIIEKDKKNYICNNVDGKKTSSFTAKKDDTDIKSSAPNNFKIDENHKEDLCNDQNKDCLYDEYKFSNNDILSELSSNCQEFNPILEECFNHLTMTGNESNQLEMYKTLNQPTSVLLNESFSSKINLSTITEVNKIPRDLVVDKNVEIVTNEIDFRPSSSNTNVNTINILNNATREYSVEIQNSYPAASSQPSKTLTIEEFPQNSMIYNDILAQETSKLDSFVSSSSDTESGKHLTENLHSLSTNDKNKQPFIEQIDKNIPNLRKRTNRTKYIPDCAESMSKKRSKCQKQIALKRQKVSPKSMASIFGASNSKIDSEQISREITKMTVKKSKKIEKLLPKNKETVSQEKLKKIAMPVEIKQDSENSNETLNQNFFSCSKTINQLFFQEPKVILERIDVSLYKNSFKKLAIVNDSGQVSQSINETNSHIPIAFKRLRSGCLKSMKEPSATNTIINLDEKPKKDSINYDMNKVVSRKSDEVKKVKFDKNLKSCSDPLVMNFSKTDPIICVDKILNSSITESINLISNDEFVSDKIQEGMDKTISDKDWEISNTVQTNMDGIPKIQMKRTKSDVKINSSSSSSSSSQLDLKPIKRGTKIVREQEQDRLKTIKSNKLELNHQFRRMSSRIIFKKPPCSCCPSDNMDDVCSSNVV